MYNEKACKEKEIDLKDLIFGILYCWRKIVLWAIILGILMSGFQLGREILSKKNIKTQTEVKAEYEKNMEMYESALEKYESDIDNLEHLLDVQKDYVRYSPLMKIDGGCKPKAYVEYFVQLDEAVWHKYSQNIKMDPTDSLVRAYIANLTKWVDWKEIKDKTGLSEVYLKELVTTNLDYDSNTFMLEVTYLDLDTAEWILNNISNQIEKKYYELSDIIGEHTISIVSTGAGYFYDSNLLDTQKQVLDKITTYENSLKDKMDAMEQLTKPDIPMELSNKNMLLEIMKYGIIGILLGGFLSTCWVGIRFVLNNRLYTEEEVEKQLGLRILGVFALPEKKGVLCRIDRWLERLEGKEERQSESAVLERGAVNIHLYTKPGDQILLTGTVTDQQLQRIGDSISKHLTDRSLLVSSNINKETESLRRLVNCQGVILVEQRGVSKFDKICREKDTVLEKKKTIIGCLII